MLKGIINGGRRYLHLPCNRGSLTSPMRRSKSPKDPLFNMLSALSNVSISSNSFSERPGCERVKGLIGCERGEWVDRVGYCVDREGR